LAQEAAVGSVRAARRRGAGGDERAMAEKIEGNWDKFVELTLQEEAVAH